MIGMLRMVVVLSVLCGLSGFALSYLKMVTAPRIEEQVLTYVQGPALARVFTHTQNSPIADRRKFPLDHGSITVFPALLRRQGWWAWPWKSRARATAARSASWVGI